MILFSIITDCRKNYKFCTVFLDFTFVLCYYNYKGKIF